MDVKVPLLVDHNLGKRFVSNRFAYRVNRGIKKEKGIVVHKSGRP